MKKITFMSFKGGAGKTTALFLLVAAINDRGGRVTLVNSDEEPHLEEWRENGIELGYWDDERIQLFAAEDDDDLTAAMQAAEDFGADYFICDTKGGGSDLNHSIILNSNFIVVPTHICRQELDSTFRTMEYVSEFLEQENVSVSSAFLINRVSFYKGQFDPEKLTQEDREGWELLEDFPKFETKIPTDEIIRVQKGKGLINLQRDAFQASKTTRFRAPNLTKRIRYGLDMLDEIEAGLAAQEEPQRVEV